MQTMQTIHSKQIFIFLKIQNIHSKKYSFFKNQDYSFKKIIHFFEKLIIAQGYMDPKVVLPLRKMHLDFPLGTPHPVVFCRMGWILPVCVPNLQESGVPMSNPKSNSSLCKRKLAKPMTCNTVHSTRLKLILQDPPTLCLKFSREKFKSKTHLDTFTPCPLHQLADGQRNLCGVDSENVHFTSRVQTRPWYKALLRASGGSTFTLTGRTLYLKASFNDGSLIVDRFKSIWWKWWITPERSGGCISHLW